jgi:hypothetical protein
MSLKCETGLDPAVREMKFTIPLLQPRYPAATDFFVLAARQSAIRGT